MNINPKGPSNDKKIDWLISEAGRIQQTSDKEANALKLSVQELEPKIAKLKGIIESTNHKIADYRDMKMFHSISPKTVPKLTALSRLNQSLASNQEKLNEVESKLAEIKAIADEKSQALVSRIEEFFKKSIEVCIDLEKEGVFCRDDLMKACKKIETLSEKLSLHENKTVEMFRKIVKRKNFDLNSLPEKNQSVVSEFLGEQDLLSFRDRIPSEEFRDFGDEYLIFKINEGTPLRKLDFSEESLKVFLEKYGKGSKCLNLDGFTITDIALFDACKNLERVSFKGCHFEDVDFEAILQHENLQKLQELDLSDIKLDDVIAYEITRFTHLKNLNLSNTGISSRGLSCVLKSMKDLEVLNIFWNDVGNEGAKAFQNLHKLKELVAWSCGITGAGMAFIGKLSNLEKLNIASNAIGDIGAQNLQNLKKLKELAAWRCGITGSGMAFIGKLTNLEVLNISSNVIENEGAEALQKLHKLKELVAFRCGITGSGMAFIGNLTNLEKLEIGLNNVQDIGAENLQNLKKLKELYVNDCGMTGSGMAFIGKLTNLELLNIIGSRIGDIGAENLQNLKKLKKLYVKDSDISVVGYSKLEEALPALKVWVWERQ